MKLDIQVIIGGLLQTNRAKGEIWQRPPFYIR